MTKWTPHGIADPHGQVKPEQCPVPAGGDGGGARTGRRTSRPAAARGTRREQRGPFGGRKCPSAPKLTARSKAPAKGRPRTSARTQPAPGTARRACAIMPALKSTPVTGPRHRDPRTRSPRRCRSNVQPPAERAWRAKSAGGRVEHVVGGEKRRVVELRGQQVITALRLGAAPARQTLGDAPIPHGEIKALVEKSLGSIRRAGQGTAPERTHRFEDVLSRTRFGVPQQFFVPGIPDLLRDSESVLSGYLSLSSSAPHLFGDRLDDFAGEVRALLANRSSEGSFWGLAGRHRGGNGPQARLNRNRLSVTLICCEPISARSLG